MDFNERGLIADLCKSLRIDGGGESGDAAQGMRRSVAITSYALSVAVRHMDSVAHDDDAFYDQEALLDLELVKATLSGLTNLRLEPSRGAVPAAFPTDLAVLANLKSLEVLGLPLNKISGLRNLRAKLRALLLSGIPDLDSGLSLVSLPGDGACATHPPWSRLTRLSLRRSGLSRVDPSLFVAAPNLRLLDLSYNRISGFLAIGTLKDLEKLDLSFNLFASVPELQIPSTLTSLRLSHNKLESLEGLACCQELEELDVAFNLLCSHSCLAQVSLLSRLRRLSTQGNPLAISEDHRVKTLAWIHRAVNPNGLWVDGLRLRGRELCMTGLARLILPEQPPFPPAQAPLRRVLSQLAEEAEPEEEEATSSIVSSATALRKKSRRRREAQIAEPEAVETQEDRERQLAQGAVMKTSASKGRPTFCDDLISPEKSRSKGLFLRCRQFSSPGHKKAAGGSEDGVWRGRLAAGQGRRARQCSVGHQGGGTVRERF